MCSSPFTCRESLPLPLQGDLVEIAHSGLQRPVPMWLVERIWTDVTWPRALHAHVHRLANMFHTVHLLTPGTPVVQIILQGLPKEVRLFVNLWENRLPLTWIFYINNLFPNNGLNCSFQPSTVQHGVHFVNWGPMYSKIDILAAYASGHGQLMIDKLLLGHVFVFLVIPNQSLRETQLRTKGHVQIILLIYEGGVLWYCNWSKVCVPMCLSGPEWSCNQHWSHCTSITAGKNLWANQ